MEFINAFITKIYPLSEASLEKFRAIFIEKKMKKATVFVKAGEVPSKFYILKSGIVRSFITNEKGKNHIRTLFTPIKTTGSLTALIKNEPSKFSYDCLTDCTVLEGSFNDFIKLTELHHDISLFYNKVLENVYLTVVGRIRELASLNATERYIKLNKEIPNINNLIAQYHIAAYLNITPVQLSRIRKELYSK